MMDATLSCGEIAIQVIRESTMWLDGGAMFGTVPKETWRRLARPDAENRIELAVRVLLVKIGGTTILVDSGIGDWLSGKARERLKHQRDGCLADRLAQLGTPAEEIDLVINTHLHFDHAGGNVTADGSVAFPNARYVWQRSYRDEVRRTDGRSRRSFSRRCFEPLEREGRVEVIDGETELVSGMRVIPTPGHCAHHQSVLFESGEAGWIFLGDLVPTATHAPLDYAMAYDTDPTGTAATKERLYDRILLSGYGVILDHEPSFAFGELAREESGFIITQMHTVK